MLDTHPKNKFQNFKKGFSLIEVIISVSILITVLVAALGFIIRLMMSAQVNLHRTLATHYSEELSEFLTGERQAYWDDFQLMADAVTGVTYCVNTQLTTRMVISNLVNITAMPGGVCPFNGLTGVNPLIYRRTVTLTKDAAQNPTRVEAQIIVQWNDGGKMYEENINKVFSSWE